MHGQEKCSTVKYNIQLQPSPITPTTIPLRDISKETCQSATEQIISIDQLIDSDGVETELYPSLDSIMALSPVTTTVNTPLGPAMTQAASEAFDDFDEDFKM